MLRAKICISVQYLPLDRRRVMPNAAFSRAVVVVKCSYSR
jgi:hypothetical protein